MYTEHKEPSDGRHWSKARQEGDSAPDDETLQNDFPVCKMR